MTAGGLAGMITTTPVGAAIDPVGKLTVIMVLEMAQREEPSSSGKGEKTCLGS